MRARIVSTAGLMAKPLAAISIPAGLGSRDPFVDTIRAALFSNSEQGFLYDLYDQSTLFQDAAGTTPWTAYGQPLGLQLDKSKGLALGSERVTNGSFASGTTGWTNNSGLATTFESVAHDGEASALHVIGGVSAGAIQASLSANGVFAVSYKIKVISGSAYVGISYNTVGGVHTTSDAASWKTVTRSVYGAADASLRIYANGASSEFYVTAVSVKKVAGNHRYQTTPTARPTIEARVNRFIGTETLATQNVTTVAGGYILRFTGTGTVTLSGTAAGAYSAGTHSITCTAGTLTATVAGTVTQADLRLSLDSACPYQRVTIATDYADIGAPRRIKYDGIDDFLQTASVDFSATDKMTVWAGVQKLSDVADAQIVALSADATTNNGSFDIRAPGSGGAAKYQCISRGTLASIPFTSSATYNAPHTSVVTLTANISGDSASLRVNGVQAASSSADQGTGNYGTYPIYFGARAGTSLRFSGEVFSPEVIRGAASTTAQIDMVERVINRNAGGIY